MIAEQDGQKDGEDLQQNDAAAHGQEVDDEKEAE